MRIAPSALAVFLLAVPVLADAPPLPAKPAPDAAFNNWLYKTPNPATWKRSEKDGNLVFSVPRPPGDFVNITLFGGAASTGDFAAQFAAAVDADQKAKGTVKVEADSGPQPSKSPDGVETVIRTMRSETAALHTYHFYLATQSKDRFDFAAFQTTSDDAFKKFAPDATALLQSLTPANSAPPDEVARLTNKPADDAPPMLPGFGTPTTQTPAPAPTLATEAPIAPIPLPVPVIPTPAPVAPQAPASAAVQAKSNIPDVPLELSPLVTNHALLQRNGKPVDGIKLSQHDLSITSPSIAVAPNGTIHVAFIEEHKNTFTYAVYHRSSADGGKTWTDAKNLSESQINLNIGRCQVIVDPQNRAYVIWRTGLAQYNPTSAEPSSRGANTNIVYRVLANSQWSKIINISEPADNAHQSDGALATFATLDAAGHVQVVWNCNTDKWHPELMTGTTYKQHQPTVGAGLVFQSTLTGTTASAPREVYLSPRIKLPARMGEDPPVSVDSLDDINGYVDAAGNPHLVALASNYPDPYGGKSHVQFFENGNAGASFDLPALSYHAWSDQPTLLVDAEGKKHVICLYPAGERPCIQDYLLGSDDEPTIIRQAAAIKGTADAMQAYQGPGGRMIVLMQMNDNGGYADNGDSYLSISNGHGWSPPVNLTNNAGRSKFASSQHGESGVVISTSYGPGPGAAAFCPDGHIALLMITSEKSLFGTSAFGVSTAGGSTSTPTLRFLKL